jgi:hypothetical protein
MSDEIDDSYADPEDWYETAEVECERCGKEHEAYIVQGSEVIEGHVRREYHTLDNEPMCEECHSWMDGSYMAKIILTVRLGKDDEPEEWLWDGALDISSNDLISVKVEKSDIKE